MINAGIKMFGRVEHKFQQCNFRLAQDVSIYLSSTVAQFIQ